VNRRSPVKETGAAAAEWEIPMRRAALILLLSSSLWTLLGALWSATSTSDTGTDPRTNAGCILDPDGVPRCIPGS
jgi:hypothetical protein